MDILIILGLVYILINWFIMWCVNSLVKVDKEIRTEVYKLDNNVGGSFIRDVTILLTGLPVVVIGSTILIKQQLNNSQE